MLRCFIFRINKVITDISLLHFLSWKSVFSEIKINVTKKQWNVVQDYSRRAAGKTLLELNKINFNDAFLTKLVDKKNAIFEHLLEHGLTPKNILPGITNLLDEIKSRGYLLACSSSSAHAALQLKKMKLFSKFDYIVDYDSNQISLLSQREKTECINPIGLVLNKLKLDGSECIGFEHDNSGLEQYRQFNVFSVFIGNKTKNSKADFNVNYGSEIPLEEIIFNYFKKYGDDREEIN